MSAALGAPTVLVTGGLGQTCAAAGVAAQCWGSNSNGQLGDGSTVALSIQPVTVAGIAVGATAVSAGSQHTCAIVHGAARCWGGNSVGQLGNGAPGDDSTVLPDSHAPVGVTGLSSGVQAIAGGSSHGCAVVSGAARCWGSNDFGQLGDNTVQLRRSPVPVSNLSSGVQAVTTGGSHSCAVVGGAAMCWGFNGNGQLGNATAENPQPGDSLIPVPVTGLTSGVQAIAAGQNHTCAIVNGGVLCWGNNASGQLGNGAHGPGPVRAPVPVTGLASGVLAVAGGLNHSCAIVVGGAVKCWGSNRNGQLGNGSTDPNAPLPPDSDVPVQVTQLTSGVQAIGSGQQHTCATTSSAVWCWGFNGNGQIAVDPDTASLLAAPHQITGLVLGGCADGSDEQVFNNGMVGCAGAVTFASRGALCVPGYQAATALQWTSNRGGGAPLHNYWTNDPLFWSGGGPSACTVSLSVGNDCGATPMRVCTAAGTDAEGNVCNWQHCGLYANAPDNFFGGCVGNTTAGTLCIPPGSPANGCTSVKSCPKWENGIVRVPASGATLEPTTTFGTGTRHVQQTCHFFACDPPTITGSISPALTTTCQTAADARSNQLKATVASSVAVEASFDSVAALNQRSAEAQATVGATRAAQTIQQFNQQSIPLGPPGVTLNNWDERWMCQNNAVTAAPATAPNDACGCNN